MSEPRSFLFAPGDQAKLLAKVMEAGADAVVLDLEDGVAPGSKATARDLTRGAIRAQTRHAGPELWVRINALDSGHWQEDLDAVVTQGLQGLRVPKAECPESLERLASALTEAERGAGLEAESIKLAYTIESAAGLLACANFCRHPRLVQLAFGEADFVADIHARPVPSATLYARSQMVLHSRAAGLKPPIAPVYTHLADDEGLRRTSEENRDLGFGGRSCIHPRQLPIVHSVFTPSDAEVAWARRVREASENGSNRAGDQFVDEAVIRRARTVLERAELREEMER